RGGAHAPHPADTATTTEPPRVVVAAADPVKTGLVASLNRPGGNVPGVNFLLNMIAPKLFEVLQEAVPKPGTVGFLVNPTGPEAEAAVSEVRGAGQALGHGVMIVHASTEREIDDAFAALAQNRVGAVLVGNDVFFIAGASRSW